MDPEIRVRRLELGDHPRQLVLVPQKDVGEEAVVVWDAALVLSFFLVKHSQAFFEQGLTRVLELGAGTGAVGLSAAAIGAGKVTLTDLPRFVPLLEESIALNKSTLSNVEAKALTWGDEKDLENLDAAFDLILVSDCIYYEASVDPLITTLVNLCKRNSECQVLLSYETRDYLESKKKVASEFFRAVGQHFRILPYKTEDCHEEYASDDIRVVKLLFMK